MGGEGAAALEPGAPVCVHRQRVEVAVVDNYEVDEKHSPWRDRKPRWTVKDLKTAVTIQCQFCNQTVQWNEGNDCVSPACPLFPFRPGKQGQNVAGIERAAKQAGRRGNAAALAQHVATKRR